MSGLLSERLEEMVADYNQRADGCRRYAREVRGNGVWNDIAAEHDAAAAILHKAAAALKEIGK